MELDSTPPLEDLIGHEITGTSFWRTLKAEDYPDDKRNLRASKVLDALARQIPSLEGSAVHRELAQIATDDKDGSFILSVSEATRAVAFSRFPNSLEDLIEDIRMRWNTLHPHEVRPRMGAPSLLMQTLVIPAAQTSEGALIRAVTEPWFEIIKWIEADPRRVFEIEARKWEEIIAGAWKQADFDDVVLTPRSGDYGRDIIATKRGVGTIRVIDQVKAFGPNHLVDADDVRALLGVVMADGASKGFLTTTSAFAPRLPRDILLAPLIPSRLELIDGQMLLARLSALARRGSDVE